MNLYEICPSISKYIQAGFFLNYVLMFLEFLGDVYCISLLQYLFFRKTLYPFIPLYLILRLHYPKSSFQI